MIAQRVGTAVLRRAGKPSSAIFTQNLAKAIVASSTPAVQKRPASTEKLTQADATSLLASQRLRRPVSPNLEVYDVKQTWFGASAWQRITGSLFSGGLYVYATAYLVAPLLGWHLESASVAAFVAGLPLAAKGGLKFLIAFPFAFHGVNGVRHLVYDLGKGFNKAQVQKGGYGILAGSVVAALGLAFLL